jgi:AbrB family transcriptional regulator (stage V sporulation protein T)
MKTTGITRRIDELGRIVIPKEIRHNMRIKKGELLEIFISDADTISLKKHSLLNNNREYIELLINLLSNSVNANIFLADTDTVIASNIDYVQNNKLKNDIRNNNKTIYLTDNYEIKNEYDIYNISPNGDLIGYLIVEYKKGKKDNIGLIKFVLSFLEKYFEFE